MEDRSYNSAVFNSLAANGFLVSVVTKDHFEPGAYSNIREAIPEWDVYGVPGSELFSSVLEGYNAGAASYEDLSPSECTKLYNTDYMPSHSNLFLITKHSSNATHNNTLLDMINVMIHERRHFSEQLDVCILLNR